jgi:hypothetical protein
MSQDDKAVITAFVAFRSDRDLPGLVVESWPDIENRDSSDIDALAGPLAIEHTSVDTVADQRRDGAWFSQVVDPVQHGPASRLSFRLALTFPYDGVARGQDWAAMRGALEAWILGEAPRLPEGRHSARPEGFPFAFDVRKASDRRPGVFFLRYAPEDSPLGERLRQQVERKAAKLRRYTDEGKRGVVLLESNDIALMSETVLVQALKLGFPQGLPCVVQELWYADTSIDGTPWFHDFTEAVGRAV